MNRFLCLKDLKVKYKARVFSMLECRTAVIYHAADGYLDRIDRVQKRFLEATELSEEHALLFHNLAPLVTRRDIAMLGMMQKTVLGEAPEVFSMFFTFNDGSRRKRTRSQYNRHMYQLEDRRNILQLEIWQNSAFGFIPIYNELPDDIAMCATVSSFQRQLQNAIKSLARTGKRNWQMQFSPRSRKRS